MTMGSSDPRKAAEAATSGNRMWGTKSPCYNQHIKQIIYLCHAHVNGCVPVFTVFLIPFTTASRTIHTIGSMHTFFFLAVRKRSNTGIQQKTLHTKRRKPGIRQTLTSVARLLFRHPESCVTEANF